MQLTTAAARNFLKKFARTGGGIVADGMCYDYGCSDLRGRNVLKDIPHSVMVISDFKSLWIRLAIMNEKGIDGSKVIEYTILPSRMAPNEFGFIILKPQGLYFFPIVFFPCLMRYVDRTLSVAGSIVSPAGTRLAKCDSPLEVWAFGCKPAFEAAIESMERSFEQPELILLEWERLTSQGLRP